VNRLPLNKFEFAAFVWSGTILKKLQPPSQKRHKRLAKPSSKKHWQPVDTISLNP
jgi:hypothetical protein